jgi:type II secretory pathway component GspD/PulD (secretin)
MMTKRQIQGRVKAKVFIFICAIAVFLSDSFLFAAEQMSASGVARYRVFSLKNISAEQGKKYLVQAGVGTVSQLPGVNALLVTAKAEDLVKASTILNLVDAGELFYIKAITPASELAQFPSNEQIAAKIGDISIGTFSNPPNSAAKTRAIIDIHGDSVIAIAPEGQLDRIISAVEQIRSSEAQAQQSSEPNKPSDVPVAEPNEANKPVAKQTQTIPMSKPTQTELEKAQAEADAELKKIAATRAVAGRADTEDYEPNELFDKLLKSISSAEPPETNLPGVALAKTGEPNSVYGEQSRTIDLKQSVRRSDSEDKAEELAPPATEEPQESNLPAEQPETEPNFKQVSKSEVHSYEPAPIADGNEMLELNLPEKLNIVDLLDLVGKYLHLDYMFDETQVKGEVSLRLQGPIKIKDLYPLLESVLKFRGFVMTRKGNLVTIVPAGEALGIDPLLHPEAGQVQLGDVVITRVFRLNYIDTASAQNLLTNMRLGANISPIPETGTLIITEYAYRMARVEELLEMVDQPGEPKQFRFRQLKYTMATTLAPKIKTLAEQLGTVSVTIAAAPSPAQPSARRIRGRPAPTPTPTAPAAAAKPAVYLDADERTNRILMIGLEEQLIVVESLIDTLDVEQQDLRTLRLYDIQHVGAEEVVKKLQELGIIGATTPTGRITAGARTTQGREAGAPVPAAPTAAAETEPLVEAPQVVVIESTNSLLVNATPEQHTRIATIISYVDSETLKQVIPYVIYGLENQDPEDLAEVLQKFIQETIKDKEGKVQQTIKKTEEEITIVPDKNTFSILVYASKKNQEWIGSLIKQLDKRRPQVLIDVSLVEIAKKDTFEYDLDLIANAQDVVTNNIIESASLPFATAKNNLEGGFNSTGATAGTAFRGFFSDNKIQALLTAIDTKHYGRILARPKILVNDNEEGKINTTQTTYVA